MESQSFASTPKWISVYLWIATAMAFMFSLLAYFKPEIQLGTWEALQAVGALSLSGPLGLYIARNLATAVSGAFALTQKSLPMAKMLLVLRLCTDGLDFVHNAASGNIPAGVFALVMCLIEAFAFYQVVKLKNT